MNANIGIDIGKKKCDVCVVDGNGKVLETGQHANTTHEAGKFAQKMAHKYAGKARKCRAACETTANMWLKTFDAFEQAGMEIKLANTYKLVHEALQVRTGLNFCEFTMIFCIKIK